MNLASWPAAPADTEPVGYNSAMLQLKKADMNSRVLLRPLKVIYYGTCSDSNGILMSCTCVITSANVFLSEVI